MLDLCAELPLDPGTAAYQAVPVLDLTAPTTAQCLELAEALERLRQHGPVLVCCALGYSRSATAVAAWLLHSGRASSVDAALELLCQARPRVVLHAAHRQALAPLSENQSRVYGY
ncbi:hypothetical protein D3C79_1005620 [compost metagenome]